MWINKNNKNQTNYVIIESMFESIAFSCVKAIMYLKSARDKICKSSHHSVLFTPFFSVKEFNPIILFYGFKQLMNYRYLNIPSNVNPQNVPSDARKGVQNAGWQILATPCFSHVTAKTVHFWGWLLPHLGWKLAEYFNSIIGVITLLCNYKENPRCLPLVGHYILVLMWCPGGR